MRALPPLLLGVIGCHSAPAVRPPVVAACSAARVGRVDVVGATPAEVAPLAVLEGTLDDPARTDRIAAVATELMRVRGYPRATIAIARTTGCGVDLLVTVDRGPKFRIAKIALDTDGELPPGAPIAALEDALGTVNAVGGAYVEERMRRALDRLAKRFHDAGWLDASIDPPVATFDEPHGTVSIAIPVRAGRRYKIGNVVARGGRAATRKAVIDALGLRGGDWYDATAVRDGIDRARRRLDRRIEMHIDVSEAEPAIDVEAVVR